MGSSRKRGQFRGPIETLPGSDEQLLGTSAGKVITSFYSQICLVLHFPLPSLVVASCKRTFGTCHMSVVVLNSVKKNQAGAL